MARNFVLFALLACTLIVAANASASRKLLEAPTSKPAAAPLAVGGHQAAAQKPVPAAAAGAALPKPEKPAAAVPLAKAPAAKAPATETPAAGQAAPAVKEPAAKPDDAAKPLAAHPAAAHPAKAAPLKPIHPRIKAIQSLAAKSQVEAARAAHPSGKAHGTKAHPPSKSALKPISPKTKAIKALAAKSAKADGAHRVEPAFYPEIGRIEISQLTELTKASISTR